MAEKACDTCGEVKPRKAFWGVNREPMSTCTACRRKEARRKRYLRDKAEAERQAERQRARMALEKQKALLGDSKMSEAVLEINTIISRIEYKLRKYNEMVMYGNGTLRTEKAIRHQTNRLDYYEEIKYLLMESARRGIDRPLEYYLTNTFLLNKHGFPCVVKDADPRLEMEADDGYDD